MICLVRRALVAGTRQDLGPATVAADGSFTSVEAVGSATQASIIATALDSTGGYAQSGATFDLVGAASGSLIVLRQDSNASDGATLLSTTAFQDIGSRIVSLSAPDQTVTLQPFDVVFDRHQPGTAFVFDPGDGLDVVRGFDPGGPGNDTLELSSPDFTNLAAVFHDTGEVGGSAFVTHPRTGDAIRLAGVTTAELRTHPKDFALV